MIFEILIIMRIFSYFTTLILLTGHVSVANAQPNQPENNGVNSNMIARARNLYEQFLESLRFMQQYADFTHPYTVPLAEQEQHSTDVLATVINQPNDEHAPESTSNPDRSAVNRAAPGGLAAAPHVDTGSHCSPTVSTTMK